jgi:hypothetical protein
LVMEYLEE